MSLYIYIYISYDTDDRDERKFDNMEKSDGKKLEEAFNTWKSKTFALTVPLRIVALRGSVPPPWIKVSGNYPLLCLKHVV